MFSWEGAGVAVGRALPIVSSVANNGPHDASVFPSHTLLASAASVPETSAAESLMTVMLLCHRVGRRA